MYVITYSKEIREKVKLEEIARHFNLNIPIRIAEEEAYVGTDLGQTYCIHQIPITSNSRIFFHLFRQKEYKGGLCLGPRLEAILEFQEFEHSGKLSGECNKRKRLELRSLYLIIKKILDAAKDLRESFRFTHPQTQ